MINIALNFNSSPVNIDNVEFWYLDAEYKIITLDLAVTAPPGGAEHLKNFNLRTNKNDILLYNV